MLKNSHLRNLLPRLIKAFDQIIGEYNIEVFERMPEGILPPAGVAQTDQQLNNYTDLSESRAKTCWRTVKDTTISRQTLGNRQIL